MAKAFRVLLVLLALILFVAAARELWQADWRGALQAASRMEPASLGLAGLLIIASFLVFALYDHLAWWWHGETRIPVRVVLRTSFVATCAAMNVGVSALSGSALRFTLYGEHGYSIRTIAAVYLRIVILFVVGWFIWLGVGLGLSRQVLAAQLGLPPALFILTGCASVVGTVGYLVLCARGPTFRIAQTEIAAPSPGFALVHLAVSAADILTSAAVFHILVSHGSTSFIHATAMFMLANTAGMISQVPGGLGVFEWIALELAGDSAGTAQSLAGLLVFRLAFFWIPLLLALPLALHSIRPRTASMPDASD